MKKFAAICLLLAALAIGCLFLFSHRSHTGLVLAQTCESTGGTWTSTTEVAGDNARVDVMERTSTIFDLATGNTLIISHPSRSYTELSMAQMVARTRASMHMDATPSALSTPLALTDTGRDEKVGAYNARVYTAETPSIKYTCWITKDFPGYAAVNAQLKKYRAMENSGALYPDLSNIDGLLVKSQIAPASGDAITVTLVSAKIQSVRDSVFRLPEDYTLLPTPPIPAPASQTPAP